MSLFDWFCPEQDEPKETQKELPSNVWEEVPGNMRRTKVPGGWIYTTCIPGHSVSLCFVPYSNL